MITSVTGFFTAAAASFFGFLIGVPVFFAIVRMLGLYAVVQEGQCRVYMLFGKVVGVIREPGLYILPFTLGLRAFLINFLGQCYKVDMRVDQEYLRSQPVNSEEGAPMGIGIWYEMFICDPVAYLFKNADPRGSLRANVSNASVRCLSNMKLSSMLENRHEMSQTVRTEVSEKSMEWGYRLGSVYIRKVHFRDGDMIRQIEAKVVNRLRQVTSAILQDGANQVNIITSTAERQASIEFAKASAMRPYIVGAALNEIAQDPEIQKALFEILETQRIVEGNSSLMLIPERNELLADLVASRTVAEDAPRGGVRLADPQTAKQPQPPGHPPKP